MSSFISKIGERLISEAAMLTTAESCTGGLIAKSITDLPGSSQWFDRGFVTYSNSSKTDLLGVDADLINTTGAVSEAVAIEMARGALKNSKATYSISVTGIAGPNGGTKEKPVGTVCFGWANKAGEVFVETKLFEGNREEIRYQSAMYALERLVEYFLI